MTIKVPVAVGKRETLLKAKDTEIILDDLCLVIKSLYIKETPKDISDLLSPTQEERKEYCSMVKKGAITDMTWYWSVEYEVYVFEVAINAESFVQLFMENRDKATELYEKLNNWIFKK